MFKRATTILMLAVAALAVSGVASAQGSGGNAASQGHTQQLMQQYRQKAQKLQQIHQNTLQNNPKLAAEQSQFEKQVRGAVKKQGYDVDQGQQRVQKMAQKLQSGKLSDSQRKQTMQKFQAERRKMIHARDAALKQPDIQKAGKQLQHDTLAAMKKQNGQTERLLSDMKSLRHKLRSTMPAPANSNNG